MRPKPLIIIAGVVLLVSLVFIWRQIRPPGPKLAHTLFRSAGQVLAQETCQAVGDRGEIVAVINGMYEMRGNAQYDEWQAFREELKKHGSVRLIATETVNSDPEDGAASPGCSSANLKKLLEQYAGADAVVFFVCLPNWKWVEQNHFLPERRPSKIIVFDPSPTGTSEYGNYLRNGYLSLLVGPRTAPAPALPGEPRTTREWFDQNFQVFTAENYEPAQP